MAFSFYSALILYIFHLQRLQREHIDPLQSDVEQVNALAQSLIQSAPLGVATDAVEAQFEEVKRCVGQTQRAGAHKIMNFGALSQCFSFFLFPLLPQLVSRERKLDSALLQSGKFSEALDSLLAWLRDAEELVRGNVRPLTADYKLLKDSGAGAEVPAQDARRPRLVRRLAAQSRR